VELLRAAAIPLVVMEAPLISRSLDECVGRRFTIPELPGLRGTFTVAVTLIDPATHALYPTARLADAVRVVGGKQAGLYGVSYWVGEESRP
jgi:hypothetical protein